MSDRPIKLAEEAWDGELAYLRSEFPKVCEYNENRRKFIEEVAKSLGIAGLDLVKPTVDLHAKIRRKLDRVFGSYEVVEELRRVLREPQE